jgi:hypothetical protein
MDVREPSTPSPTDIERALLEAAVEKVRNNPAPGRSHGVVRQEMLEKIAKLDARIAVLPTK